MKPATRASRRCGWNRNLECGGKVPIYRDGDAALDRIAVANTIGIPDRKIQSAVVAGALQK